MSDLIIIGYWNNKDDMYPEYPHPQDLVDNKFYKDKKLKKKILHYLNHFSECNHMRGFSQCRFCGTVTGTCERTDKKYIWPIGLAHYVLAHNVKLPDEFIKHILRLRGRCKHSVSID